MPIAWTGNFLRIGLASKAGGNGIAFTDQGGCASHSRSVQIDDGWEDKAAAGFT
ncbi:hypothetical protein ABZ636_39220 [Streptomyces sp. NPDC007251]|uniref:hypothetical protein n=1 Tax=unclassified Streptomyces TaxID=2593676 RepID=UPI0033F1FFA7